MDYEEASTATLSARVIESLQRFGERESVGAGDVLFTAGDADQDFFVIESGEVEIVRPATSGAEEMVLVAHGAGRFLGELNMLTGQRAYLTARVTAEGVVTRISTEGFQRLMREEAQISDTILRAFMARRAMLRVGEGARSVEILGSRWAPASLALRSWAARMQIPHLWMDIDDPVGEVFASTILPAPGDLPVVVTSSGVLRAATPASLADELGLSPTHHPGGTRDLVIVGAGPAGLGAAVCAASEGLDTVVLDATGVGGQAAASARIENYVGFPSGIPGAELTSRAVVQAHKFGARVLSPCRAVDLQTVAGHLQVTLAGGSQEQARSVVIATGASYRTLGIGNWERFEGTSIFYAATELEARACVPAPLIVVGGANSAGQAAIFLADRGSPVTLVVRGDDLARTMSRYLVGRVEAHSRIRVETQAEVVALDGEVSLETVTLARRGQEPRSQACEGLFCFIGATPASEFAQTVAKDANGFIETDQRLKRRDLSEAWRLLGREPHPFETSVPGVFAVGDVRSGSVKRVATAVGEGSAVISSVHAVVHPRATT